MSNQEINEINRVISEQPWLDFEVEDFSFDKLKIVGSKDLTYGHQIEIMFNKVYHVSINSTWSTDTSNPVLIILVGNERERFIDDFGLEEEFEIFKIVNEDFKPFYVACESIEFDKTKVYYYKKEPLEDNERIADWVV